MVSCCNAKNVLICSGRLIEVWGGEERRGEVNSGESKSRGSEIYLLRI
jgi:hypothetical protein